MKNYRKKPVVVSAMQYTGENIEEVMEFVQGNAYMDSRGLIIQTLEGEHIASINDFIIKGIHGEFYPCKPDIFSKTYELV